MLAGRPQDDGAIPVAVSKLSAIVEIELAITLPVVVTVASGVAVQIVDQLEAVEVEIGQRQRLAFG